MNTECRRDIFMTERDVSEQRVPRARHVKCDVWCNEWCRKLSPPSLVTSLYNHLIIILPQIWDVKMIKIKLGFGYTLSYSIFRVWGTSNKWDGFIPPDNGSKIFTFKFEFKVLYLVCLYLLVKWLEMYCNPVRSMVNDSRCVSWMTTYRETRLQNFWTTRS